MNSSTPGYGDREQMSIQSQHSRIRTFLHQSCDTNVKPTVPIDTHAKVHIRGMPCRAVYGQTGNYLQAISWGQVTPWCRTGDTFEGKVERSKVTRQTSRCKTICRAWPLVTEFLEHKLHPYESQSSREHRLNSQSLCRIKETQEDKMLWLPGTRSGE